MIDELDRRIIGELLRDGRRPLEQVARAVNLSRPAVHERVRRLEAAGVIRGYTAQVDWAKLGYAILACVQIRHRGTCAAVAPELLAREAPGAVIADCHRVAGDYCLMLWIRATSTMTLQDQLDAFRNHPAVLSTHTTIILSTIREGLTDHELRPADAPAPAAAGRRPQAVLPIGEQDIG